MKNKILDKIINIIRENMTANAPGTGGGGGSQTDPTGKNGLVGFDPTMKPKKFFKGKRKPWLDYLKNK
jgi:hypothetical protein